MANIVLVSAEVGIALNLVLWVLVPVAGGEAVGPGAPGTQVAAALVVIGGPRRRRTAVQVRGDLDRFYSTQLARDGMGRGDGDGGRGRGRRQLAVARPTPIGGGGRRRRMRSGLATLVSNEGSVRLSQGDARSVPLRRLQSRFGPGQPGIDPGPGPFQRAAPVHGSQEPCMPLRRVQGKEQSQTTRINAFVAFTPPRQSYFTLLEVKANSHEPNEYSS